MFHLQMTLRVFREGTLFGTRYGSGDPRVLALHGWGRDRSDFAAALGTFDALSLDLPGFGASPPPVEAMGAAAYADVVAPVLAEEFRTPPVVVGHSFGGRVATCLASAHPERVRGLVLIGVPLLRASTRTRRSLRYRTVRWANQLGLLSDERLETERRRHGSADYRAAEGVMRAVLVTVVNESYEQQLAAIRIPVAMVWGRHDTAAPVWVAEQARNLIGTDRVSLEVVEEAGHDVHLSHPNVVRDAVEGLLA